MAKVVIISEREKKVDKKMTKIWYIGEYYVI